MAEPETKGFHEIQLNGKQLVFVFMAALALAVGVFLLGVSVGKGVRGTEPPATVASDAGAPGDTMVPSPTLPPTQTKPNDLDYDAKLRGRGTPDPASAVPPTPAGDAPPAAARGDAARGAVTTSPTPAPTPASRAAAPPVKPAATAAETPKPTPPPQGDWVVQVDSFNSKDRADQLIVKLKAAGYTAFLFTAAPPAPIYRVRIGPFPQRPEAVTTANKLVKEGYKPFVTR